jgi:tetratricopeptide (TPR) repeat protein
VPDGTPDRARTARLRRAAVILGALLAAGCASGPRLADLTAATAAPSRVELEATPFHPQTQYQCGPAATATVLGAAGVVVDPDDLVAEVYLPARQGSLQPEIVAAIRSRGLLPYPLDASLAAIVGELASGRPVLVLQRQGLGPWPAWHYAVVVGYDARDDSFVLRSGREARRRLSARVLNATWARADHWAVVALPPGEFPARPDVARYMTAAAGLEAVGRVEEAAAAYRAAAAHWPESPWPQLGLANVAAARGDWVAAEGALRAALVADPASVAALNNRAEVLRRLGCHVRALDAIEAGRAALAPDDALLPTLERTRADIAAELAQRSGPRHCALGDAPP